MPRRHRHTAWVPLRPVGADVGDGVHQAKPKLEKLKLNPAVCALGTKGKGEEVNVVVDVLPGLRPKCPATGLCPRDGDGAEELVQGRAQAQTPSQGHSGSSGKKKEGRRRRQRRRRRREKLAEQAEQAEQADKAEGQSPGEEARGGTTRSPSAESMRRLALERLGIEPLAPPPPGGAPGSPVPAAPASSTPAIDSRSGVSPPTAERRRVPVSGRSSLGPKRVPAPTPTPTYRWPFVPALRTAPFNTVSRPIPPKTPRGRWGRPLASRRGRPLGGGDEIIPRWKMDLSKELVQRWLKGIEEAEEVEEVAVSEYELCDCGKAGEHIVLDGASAGTVALRFSDY